MLWDESADNLILGGGKVEVVGINDTSALTGMLIKSSSSSSMGLFGVEGSGTGHITGSIARATLLASTASGSALQLGSSGYIRATIASGGNVGIGTTSPTSKLTVDGTGRFTGHLDVASSSDITGPLRVYNGLGVGGSAWVNPSTALEVSSSGANGLDISEDAAQSNTSGRLFFSNDTSSQGVAIMNTLGSLKFQTGAVPNSTSGTTRMTLSSGGLGTTVPITVGVDDTGHDVKFFGDTSGRYVEWDASADSLEFTDNARVKFGDGNDFQFWHSGSHSYVDNAVGDLYIVNNTDNGDITFQCDNGSGGVETYFFLDGSLSSGSPYTIFPDGANLALGTSADCTLYHNGSHTYISNVTGSLIIQNLANDQDIVFECDDGNGGNATYFYLDGSAAEYSSGSTDALLTRFPDASKIALGSGADMTLFHNGTDSYITNGTGDLRIYNAADDKDIVFQSDDGSGGIETYFFLDGSYADGSYTYTRWNDGGVIALGDARDLRLWHDPNTNSSYIRNSTNDLIIENLADDKDIIFQSDDGSGGVTAYLTLDGSTTYIKMHKHLFMDDSKKVLCGTDGDLELYHDGTNGLLKENTGDLTIMNGAADKDIIFQCDDGSGGEETYFFLDGSLSGGDPVTIFPDDSYLGFGADSDLNIHHNGVDSKLRNQTGNLVIEQNANDKDIVFKCDDGSGGTTEYFYLDGSAGNILFGKEIRLLDGVQLQLGTGNDMQLTHNGANGFITNNTGDLTIKNNADDKDIIFQCDDGSGGVETYFYLDGSLSGGSPYTIFPDHSHLTFGNETDLQIVHNGSHSYIDNYTGTLHIRNAANDGRVRFQCDDGAGGLATYFDLEGGQAAHNCSATTMLMTWW